MAEIENLEDEFGDFEEAKGNIHEVNAEPLQQGTQNQENEENKREESNSHSLFQEGQESRAINLFQEEMKNQSTEIKANKGWILTIFLQYSKIIFFFYRGNRKVRKRTIR